MELSRFVPALESVLFASDKPITLARIRNIFGEEAPLDEVIHEAVETLRSRYQDTSFGFELREALGGFHFCTKAEHAPWLRRFFETKPFRLGRSSLEALAIIAYRQPVTRAEIDQVRGLDSSHLLRVLIERGLVQMAGKADVPGRPVQYATTPKFLETVGLNQLTDLPPLSELEKLQGHAPPEMPSLEDGLDRLMEDTQETVAVSSAEDRATLEAIDSLIDSAEGSKEVFESELHREIAGQNQFALEKFAEFSRSVRNNKRRKGDRPEEDVLTVTPLPLEGAPDVDPEGTTDLPQ